MTGMYEYVVYYVYGRAPIFAGRCGCQRSNQQQGCRYHRPGPDEGDPANAPQRHHQLSLERKQRLKNLGLTFSEPQGAYYVLMDVSEFGVKDDVKFCEWMTQHVGVAAVPGSSFFREDIHSLVRFHFAKKDNTLNAALDNLSSLRKKCADAQNVIWR